MTTILRSYSTIVWRSVESAVVRYWPGFDMTRSHTNRVVLAAEAFGNIALARMADMEETPKRGEE